MTSLASRRSHSAARASKAGAEDLVRDDVELLLVFALHVDLASEASHVGQAGALNEAANLLACQRNRREDNGELGIDVSLGFLLNVANSERRATSEFPITSSQREL
jgi:hypothetical protein